MPGHYTAIWGGFLYLAVAHRGVVGVGTGHLGVEKVSVVCLSALGDAFFFSSRRRHTRFKCDWSSDVCSSDLGAATSRGSRASARPASCEQSTPARMTTPPASCAAVGGAAAGYATTTTSRFPLLARNGPQAMSEIGRASCRERG